MSTILPEDTDDNPTPDAWALWVPDAGTVLVIDCTSDGPWLHVWCSVSTGRSPDNALEAAGWTTLRHWRHRPASEVAPARPHG